MTRASTSTDRGGEFKAFQSDLVARYPFQGRQRTHSLLPLTLSLVRPDHNMTSFQGVLQIYELLVSVAHGMKSLELRVDM